MGRDLSARRQERQELADRLTNEGRSDLAGPLRDCATLVHLACTNCGTIQKTPVETRCKRRWCPVCAPAIAAVKAMKIRAAHSVMKWPLFLTLTTPNTEDPAELKRLSKRFSAFRRTKWWKERDVKGGVACYEITNKGKGWHPHLHALVDCRWLASTPEPSRLTSLRENKRRSKEAAEEVSKRWGVHLGMDSGAITWAKRAHDDGVALEIAKYAVKGSDLLEMTGRASTVIDVLAEMRTMITWGSVRPLGPIFEAFQENHSEEYEGCQCDSCQSKGDLVPEPIYQMIVRQAFR